MDWQMTPASGFPSRPPPSRSLPSHWPSHQLRVRGSAGVFRHSRRDALLVSIALVHAALGVLLVAWAGRMPTGQTRTPLAPLVVGVAFVAIGLWWGSNTVSHNQIHNPIFVGRGANRVFSAFLSVLLGVPQTVWKERHLRHHSGETPRTGSMRRLGIQGATECGLVLAAWGALLVWSPRFALAIYAPGYLLGLALCGVQGHYEHVGNGAVSHYGAFYNRLWFNDGHHAEHHRRPTEHWSRLPLHRELTMDSPGVRASAYPPVLRWLESLGALRAMANHVQAEILGTLERVPIASSWMRRWVIASHARAFDVLLRRLDVTDIRRIGVVGGGLFPRTVMVLHGLLPGRSIVVIDTSARNIEVARRVLSAAAQSAPGTKRTEGAATAGCAPDVEFVEATFDPEAHTDFDLLVFPLAYVGDRAALYRSARTRAVVVVHDWMWQKRGDAGAIVSPFLLKRVNLVRGDRTR